jgi:putative acyl-CoA dehydrogenase
MTVEDAGTAPATHSTHQVLNQPPPRVDINEFTANTPLMDYLIAIGEAGEGATELLEPVGAAVGSAQVQDDARLAHKYPPVLRTHNIYGQRLVEVE